MSDTVSIEVFVQYNNDPAPNGTIRSTDSLEDAAGNALSGSADSSGTTTNRVLNPNSDRKEDRQRHKDLPEGATLTTARAEIKRSCGNHPDIEAKAKGNVSAKAWVEGNCIYASAVTRTESVEHGVETVTITERACCPQEEPG